MHQKTQQYTLSQVASFLRQMESITEFQPRKLCQLLDWGETPSTHANTDTYEHDELPIISASHLRYLHTSTAPSMSISQKIVCHIYAHRLNHSAAEEYGIHGEVVCKIAFSSTAMTLLKAEAAIYEKLSEKPETQHLCGAEVPKYLGLFAAAPSGENWSGEQTVMCMVLEHCGHALDLQGDDALAKQNSDLRYVSSYNLG